MGTVLAPDYKVCYRSADAVSRVSNALAGGFMYFATAQDAMDTGLFCQKIFVPVWDWSRENRFDFLGKRFEVVRKDAISLSDCLLVV